MPPQPRRGLPLLNHLCGEAPGAPQSPSPLEGRRGRGNLQGTPHLRPSSPKLRGRIIIPEVWRQRPALRAATQPLHQARRSWPPLRMGKAGFLPGPTGTGGIGVGGEELGAKAKRPSPGPRQATPYRRGGPLVREIGLPGTPLNRQPGHPVKGLGPQGHIRKRGRSGE